MWREMSEKIVNAMDQAEAKAWESLSGYKFLMFGYHAATWVNLSHLLRERPPNPFYQLVKAARTYTEESL